MNEIKPELDWSALTYEPLATRPSKVDLAQMGQLAPAGASFTDFLATLPNQLGGKNLRALITTIAKAHKEGRRIIAAAGGHVIKTGCGPYLADWMRKGVIQGLALNGAASIHDLELALVGDQGAHLQILEHRHAREDAADFRRLRQLEAGDLMRRQIRDVLAGELDGQRVAQGRLADQFEAHPRQEAQGHQSLIHRPLGVERGQFPELTGQELGKGSHAN